MIDHQFTAMVIGLLLAAAILFLVRRDHLHGPYAYWWLFVALCAVVLAIWPQIIDRLAASAGISYPPMFAVIVAMALLLVKMLKMDIERSRQERRLRRLTQRLAMLEEENRRLAEKTHPEEDGIPPSR